MRRGLIGFRDGECRDIVIDIERLVQPSEGAERMDHFACGRHRARRKGDVFIGDVGCVINMEDVAAFRNEEKVKPAVRAFDGGGFYFGLVLSIEQL